MGCLTEDTHFAFFKLLLKSAVATSTVRVEDIACLFVALAHRLLDLLVAIGRATNKRGDALVCLFWRQLAILAVEIDDACEV